MDDNFWWSEAIQTVTYASIAYAAGRAVERHGVKVNYTRKINFFALYVMPFLLERVFPYEHTLEATAARSLLAAGMLFALVRPIRKRVPLARTMFASFDRPEDRPHTLLWVSTQILAGYAVLIPMSMLFAGRGFSELMVVPVLIHGLGDGLAEPVGVRFGRHRYSTRVFFGRVRRYTRSYEGSACVLVAGLLAVAIFRDSFSAGEFAGALLVVPTLTTLAEAWSPHTWDTPYIFLAGTTSLLAVKAWL